MLGIAQFISNDILLDLDLLKSNTAFSKLRREESICQLDIR